MSGIGSLLMCMLDEKIITKVDLEAFLVTMDFMVKGHK